MHRLSAERICITYLVPARIEWERAELIPRELSDLVDFLPAAEVQDYLSPTCQKHLISPFQCERNLVQRSDSPLPPFLGGSIAISSQDDLVSDAISAPVALNLQHMAKQFNLTLEAEKHLHHVDCLTSFEEAWQILQELRKVSSWSQVHAAAYRYALVAYSRPFTRSDGEHKKHRKAYMLSNPAFTGEELLLHRQIVELRHKVLAHSDLIVQKADISVHRFSDQFLATVFTKCRADLPDIEKVIRLVECSIEHAKELFTQSEATLAPPFIDCAVEQL